MYKYIHFYMVIIIIIIILFIIANFAQAAYVSWCIQAPYCLSTDFEPPAQAGTNISSPKGLKAQLAWYTSDNSPYFVWNN